MFKTTLSQKMTWLVAVFLLPLPLVATYLLGLEPGATSQKLGVAYGIVAYVWLLLTLYVGTKPVWLERVLGLDVAGRMSQLLSLVALVFSGFHKELNPAFGLVEQTGDVALMVLVSAGIYWVVFSQNGLAKVLPGWSQLVLNPIFGRRLEAFLQGLTALTCGLVFVHTLLIPSIRSNTAFMVVFLAVSLPIFIAYIKSKLAAPAPERLAEAMSPEQV